MSTVSFIGEHPLARNADATLISRIATAFPRSNTIVTLPGIHATQRIAYSDSINQQRIQEGKPPLTEDEQVADWALSVDLIIDDDDSILIRPDPDNMELAFEADEMLQEMRQFVRQDLLISKRKIRFLHVLNSKVRYAIQRRGEAWRIHPLPTSPEAMTKMIVTSRIAIAGRPIYYYNATSGTRWLTYHEFALLGKLDEEELRRHLAEIARYSALYNLHGRPEVDFFGIETGFGSDDLQSCNFPGMEISRVRAAWEWLCRKFEAVVPQILRVDNVDIADWRNRMYCALIDHRGDVIGASEEALLGLGSEWFMQVEWLPGARFVEGELIFDSVFDEQRLAQESVPGGHLEETVRGLICNLVQDYGDIEYLNIGRVTGSLGAKKLSPGRRDVFVVQVKQRGEKEELQIVRMQKWDVRERLSQGKNMLDAIIESENYTEYILDRRLACKQLGMNLSSRVAARKLAERYSVPNRREEIIRSTYFQRGYVYGISSNKLHTTKLANENYAAALARLLGKAAAPNLIVGRCDVDGRLIFDDGDEVVVEDESGLPTEIFVADHTGTFGNFRGSLHDLAPQYGVAVNRRLPYVSDHGSFVKAYLDAFVERFEQIQAEYRHRQRAFDTLFKHRPYDPGGNLACRWVHILKRLAPANAKELANAIRNGIAV